MGTGSANGEEQTRVQYLESVLASSTASIASRLVCHPLDTAKARLQNPGSEFKTTAQVIQRTLSEEGLRGLYRGLGTVVGLGTPAFVLYLTTYETSKKVMSSAPGLKDYPSLGHFLSGMIAETVSCVVYVPVDVIKERQQVQRRLVSGKEIAGSLPMYYGTVHALQTIYQQEGIRGVYRGYGATLLSFGPFSAFYFAFYEQFKTWSSSFAGGSELPFPFILASAASAGALAAWITTPLDLVRLRLQVQRGSQATVGSETVSAGSQSAAYKNTWDGLVQILRKEGTVGLFRGAGARIAFYTPSTMISMSLYDHCKNMFAKLLE